MGTTENYQHDKWREVAELAEADRDKWRGIAFHIANRLSAYTGLDAAAIVSRACDQAVRGD